ncbi:MAG: PAS domain S-box protein [Methanoregula sp.]|nr:PAS domain S-box protein [Methanoregula sp.]
MRTKFGQIPFILFTGKGREEVVIQAINSGADFYLQKGGESGAQFAELSHKIKSAASRKLADGALKRSEENYRHLIEHSYEAIGVAQDGVLKLVNHRVVELTGYSEQELLSMSFLVFIHPDDRAMVMERYQKRMKSEESPSRYACRLSPKDGSIRWVEISVAAIDWDGRPATLNFVTDITERKQAEDALAKSEERNRSIVEALPGLIFHFSADGRFIDCQFNNAELLLLQPDHVIGKHVAEILPPNLAHLTERKLRETLDSGQLQTFEYSLTLQNQEHFFEARMTPSGANSVMSFVHDITERKRAKEALVESESFNRNLIENLPDYIGVTTPDGKILYMNLPATKALGYTVEELIGTSVLSYVAEESRDDVISRLAARYAGGEVPPYEIAVLSRDRRRISVIVKGTTIQYRDTPALLLVLTDITEHKRAEEALRENEERFRALVETSPDMIWEIDSGGIFRYISPQIRNIMGYEPEMLVGRAVTELNPEPAHPYVMRDIARHVALRKSIITVEVPALHKDGRDMVIEIRSSVIFDRNGEPVGLRGNARDITERKRVEDALQESEERYRLLAEHMTDIVWLMDMDVKTTYQSPSSEKLRGYTSQEIQDLPLEKNLTPESLKLALEVFFKEMPRIKGDTDYNPVTILELEYYRKDGTTFWLESKFSIIRDGSGKPVSILGEGRDITERKRADDALRESEEKFKYISELIPDFAYSCTKAPNGGFAIDWITGAPEQITGYTPREIKEMTCWKFLVIDEDIPVFEKNVTGLSPGESIRCELRIRRKDGGIMWLSSYAKCVTDQKEPGNHRLYGACRNITERKRAERILRDIVDKNPISIQIVDKDGFTLTVNSAHTSLFGAVMPSDFSIFNDSQLKRLGFGELIERIKNGEVVNFPDTYYNAHDSVSECPDVPVWVRTVVFPLKDDNGKPEQFVLMHENITDRKRADEALLESEKKYRNIYIKSVEGIFQSTHEGRFISANPAAARMLGYDSSEELISTVKDIGSQVFIDPDDRVRFIRLLEKDGFLKNFEVKCRHKNGNTIWGVLNIYAVGDADGNILYHDGTCQDITDRKQVEAEIRESEERFRAIYDQSPIAIELFDTAGTLVHANPACLKLFGAENIQVLRGFSLFADPNINDEYKAKLHQKEPVHYQGPFDFEKVKTLNLYPTSRNGIIWLDVIITPLGNRADSITGFLVQITDITERKRAERILQDIIDKNPMSIQIVDKDGFTLTVNSAHTSLFGAVPPSDFSIFNDFQLKKQGFGELIERIKHGESVNFPDTYYNAHDSFSEYPDVPVWVRAVVFPLMDNYGKLDRFVFMHENITERKKAEMALHDSERFLDSIIEQIPDMIFVKDAQDLRFVRFNKAGEDLLGYSREELLGKNDYDILPKHEADFFTRNDKEVLRKNQLIEIPDEKIQTRHKGERILHTKKLPIVDEKGDPKYLLGISEDITESKRVKDALQKNLTLYKGIIEATDTGFVKKKKKGNVLDANQEYLRLSGHENISQIRGRNVVEWTAGYEKEKNAEAIDNCFREGQTRNLQIDYVNAEGKITPIEINATVVKVDGAPQILTLCRDITARKKAEKTIRLALAEKEVLLREIHHRVKNNLAGILALIELQIGSLSDPAAISLLKEMETRIRSMALVHESLYLTEDLARINVASYTETLTRHLFQVYRTAIEVRCTIEMGDVAMSIETAIPCGLVMNEIVTNSLKYAFPSSFSCEEIRGEPCTITLTLHREGSDYLLKIADNGIGIPEGIDVTMSHSLGLFLIRFIVEHQLRGSLLISTAGGTTYTIRFPEPVVKERQTDEKM